MDELVLAIDDDEHTLKMLEMQLKKMNFNVITSSTGKKGVELARTGHPDLILLDLMMPDMDGFQVLLQLHKFDETKKIPILMLTSKSAKEDVMKAMRWGVSDYIIKPYDFEMLGRKVTSAIKYSRMQKIEEADERTQHIIVTRDIGRTVISFVTHLRDRRVIDEMKKVFNTGFLTLTKRDHMIIDLRNIDDLNDGDSKILISISEILGGRDLYIVAGRHYGTLIASVDFPERIQLFISIGDMEHFLVSKDG